MWLSNVISSMPTDTETYRQWTWHSGSQHVSCQHWDQVYRSHDCREGSLESTPRPGSRSYVGTTTGPRWGRWEWNQHGLRWLSRGHWNQWTMSWTEIHLQQHIYSQKYTHSTTNTSTVPQIHLQYHKLLKLYGPTKAYFNCIAKQTNRNTTEAN